MDAGIELGRSSTIDRGSQLTQTLEIQLQGPHSIDDLLSLRNYINAEDELRASAKVEQSPGPEGALGAVTDLVTVALSHGGAAAILAPVVIAWIRQRHSKISVRVKRQDGYEVELQADRIKAADTRQLRQLAIEISNALGEGSS